MREHSMGMKRKHPYRRIIKRALIGAGLLLAAYVLVYALVNAISAPSTESNAG